MPRRKKSAWKKLLFSFVVLISTDSCQKKIIIPPYILSVSSEIQKFESEDNFSCNNFNLFFDSVENQSRELYWRCRLSYAKIRQNNFVEPMSIRDQEMSGLIAKISSTLLEEKNSNLNEELEKIDAIDHQKCLELGFTTETDDKQKIDKYFLCRKRLIEQESDSFPFGNLQYAEIQNRSYNLGYVVNQSIYKAKENEISKKQSYPECKNFQVFSDDFKKCVQRTEKISFCLSSVKTKKLAIQLNQSFVCQKQAYIRFGNELLKDENKKMAAIARRNYISDYQNNLNFDGLGIDEQIFTPDYKPEAGRTNISNPSKSNQQESESFFKIDLKKVTSAFSGLKNSDKDPPKPLFSGVGSGGSQKNSPEKSSNKNYNQKENGDPRQKLYNRYELGVLRQKYISSCQNLMSQKLKQFEEEAVDKCRIGEAEK